MGEPPREQNLTPRPGEKAQGRHENPLDDKNRVITRLKKISSVAQRALDEQRRGNEKHIFNQKAGSVIRLGNAYTKYLEDHIADPDMDPKVFNRIASLASYSLLMNIEPYGGNIRSDLPANQFLVDYLNKHPDLKALDPGGKEGPWGGIKEPLYYSQNNDIRERYRESIIAHARELIQAGEFTPRDVDHLERFLVDPKGRQPNVFIPEYVASHINEIKAWAPLSVAAFQEQTVSRIANYKGEMSKNEILLQLDQELASIKPEHVKDKNINYADRQKKIAFIRDLRFGRINFEGIKAQVAQRMNEITRRPDLQKTLAPLLRQHWKQVNGMLTSTAGQDIQARRAAILPIVGGLDMSAEAKQKVLQYLETHLK